MAADIQIAGGTGPLGNQYTAGTPKRPAGGVERSVARHAYYPRSQWRRRGVAERLDRVGQQVVVKPNGVCEPENMKTIRGSIQGRGDNLGRELGGRYRQRVGGDVGDGIDNRGLAV